MEPKKQSLLILGCLLIGAAIIYFVARAIL